MSTRVRVGEGEDAAQVAADLLSLTDNPFEVQTNTDDGLSFIVPDELALKYMQVGAEITVDGGGTDQAPKRRGRARKDV